MKPQFDANQEYQLKAIEAEAVVNLFKGLADNSGGLRFEMTESADGYLHNSCFEKIRASGAIKKVACLWPVFPDYKINS